MRFRVKNKPTQVPEIEAELLVSDDGDLELWLNDIRIAYIDARSGRLVVVPVPVKEHNTRLKGIDFSTAGMISVNLGVVGPCS